MVIDGEMLGATTRDNAARSPRWKPRQYAACTMTPAGSAVRFILNLQTTRWGAPTVADSAQHVEVLEPAVRHSEQLRGIAR